MDVRDLAEKHPALLEKILLKSTGPLGEILVAEELIKLGYSVEPASEHSIQKDLIVGFRGKVSFGIEVKSGREKRPTWWVEQCPDPKFSQFWCFVANIKKTVSLSNFSDVEIFVLSTDEARDIWLESKYNKNKDKSQSGDIRRWQIPDDSLRAWHKISTGQRL